MREHTPVAALERDRDGARVTAVMSAGGERLEAGEVVLAAGAWSGELLAAAAGERIPVRPVKGQIMRLRDPAGPGLLTRTVRYEGGYLLPRGDGRYVLGATVEERGFELTPTAGGVYELLRDARELVPGVTELELEEVSVGLRPGSPDNAPVIGRGDARGADPGDRPPPQRHPAGAPDRGADARAARRRRTRRGPRRAARDLRPGTLRAARRRRGGAGARYAGARA